MDKHEVNFLICCHWQKFKHLKLNLNFFNFKIEILKRKRTSTTYFIHFFKGCTVYYECLCTPMPYPKCGGQRTPSWTWFSASTMWILKNKLSLSAGQPPSHLLALHNVPSNTNVLKEMVLLLFTSQLRFFKKV